MNRLHKHRLCYIILIAIGVGLAVSLILYALKQNINVFLTPTEVKTSQAAAHYQFRLGGMVKPGSVKRDAQQLRVNFVVTDGVTDIPVIYTGILPDLFREGKGIIAEGILTAQGAFKAQLVLAKHDENYMPKSIAQKMGKI